MCFLQTVPAERVPTGTVHCEGTSVQCGWADTMLANLVRKRDAEVAVGPWTPLDVRVAVDVTSQDLPLQLLVAAHMAPHVSQHAYQKSTNYHVIKHQA